MRNARKGTPKRTPRSLPLGWKVESRWPRDLDAAAVRAWQDLAERALDPNVFAEPDYVLAAAQHLPEGRNVVLILLWHTGPQGEVLRGVLPVVAPRLPWIRQEARLWDNPMALDGTPLIDGDVPATTVAAALTFLEVSDARVSGLRLPRLPTRGSLAVLLAGDANLPAPRWRMRPAADGIVVLLPPATRVTGPVDVRDAVEAFLALDATNARERGQDAVLASPTSATFLRAVTRRLARRGACAVDLVHDGETLVAATIHLGQGHSRRAWLATAAKGVMTEAATRERIDAVLPLAAARAA